MDDSDKMDLVLNSDFESSFLNCWEDPVESTPPPNSSDMKTDDTKVEEFQGKRGGSLSGASSPLESERDAANETWERSSAPGFSRLPSFMEMEVSSEKSASSPKSERIAGSSTEVKLPPAALRQTTQEEAQLGPSWQFLNQVGLGAGTEAPTQQTGSTTSEHKAQETHEQGVPNADDRTSPNPVSASDASHTEVGSMNGGASVVSSPSRASHKGRRQGPSMPSRVQQSETLPPSSAAGGASAEETGTTSQLHPLAIPVSANCSPPAAAGTGSAISTEIPNSQLNALYSFNLNSLASNFANSTGFAPIMPPHTANTANSGPAAAAASNATRTIPPVKEPSKPAASSKRRSKKQHGRQGKSSSSNSSSNNRNRNRSNNNNSPPPFYLFDAPIELRHNFMQSQRMHGLPVMQDSNTLHYGFAVNGFHPQINANPAVANVKLIDARHGKPKGAGNIKNEREQKRAQKITELIEQLRVDMENSGWKVETRSKFHTLSSCADYVRHLIKTNKEKEQAVKKVKEDLEEKRRKLEEEKALQERSDPESVTSSLTASTGESMVSSGGGPTTVHADKTSAFNSADRKRKPVANESELNECKKARASSSEYSSDRVQCVSIDKTVSSVSDLTDSNRGSSTNSGSDVLTSSQSAAAQDEGVLPAGPSSICSDAAVVRGLDFKGDHVDLNDVIIRGRKSDKNRKRKAHKKSSPEESFELDYEEVFLKSNVPQLIATPAGRIARWNEFFLKATGFSKADVARLNIFSLVRQDKLSAVFDIVATALRTGSVAPPAARGCALDECSNDNPPGSSGSSSQDQIRPVQRKWNYSAVTLPCIQFPAAKEQLAETPEKPPSPLFLTITLMADENPCKQCFHCVFTDCPVSSNGAIGSITPDLLSLLFRRKRKVHDNEKSSQDTKAPQTSRPNSSEYKTSKKGTSSSSSSSNQESTSACASYDT